MSVERKVFLYLDDQYSRKSLDMEKAPRDVRLHFELPPTRSVELVNRWAETFQNRHPQGASCKRKRILGHAGWIKNRN